MEILERFREKLDNFANEEDIICIQTIDTKEKQVALNYMLKRGWVCVQNDSLYADGYVCFVLTFAKSYISDQFK